MTKLNKFEDEWLHDYDQSLYIARELMKQNAYKHIFKENAKEEEQYKYAKQIIRSHFMRSVDAFINDNGKRYVHPSFNEYAAMMLKQDDYLSDLPQTIRWELEAEFGKMDGIQKGSYYTRPKE